MLYRKLGKTNVESSVLGFGAMRLPMVGNPGGLAGFDPNIPIDEPRAQKMIEHAVEAGEGEDVVDRLVRYQDELTALCRVLLRQGEQQTQA